jgi:FkbM family methyltransferase
MNNKFIEIRKIILIFLIIKKVENWVDYFLDLFKIIRNNNIVYKTRDGLKYYSRTNTADRGIINAIILEDEYKVLDLKLKNLNTVIDIGGQNGYFSIYVSKNVKNIFIYEPVFENYQNILKNIKINNLEHKIIPFNLAVSNKKEKIKIYLSDDNSGGHSEFIQGDKLIQANSITMQEIFNNNKIEKCDLLKIDIEGGEYNILYNLDDKYFKKIENIRLECHNINKEGYDLKSLIKFLKTKNYKVDFKKNIVFANK